MKVTGLDPNDQLIVRVGVDVDCFGQDPTGNLQAAIDSMIFDDDGDPATTDDQDAINAGVQCADARSWDDAVADRLAVTNPAPTPSPTPFANANTNALADANGPPTNTHPRRRSPNSHAVAGASHEHAGQAAYRRRPGPPSSVASPRHS